MGTRVRRSGILLVMITLWSASLAAGKPLFLPVTGFELSRYLGTWYEIARLPTPFEKDLVGVTATYSLRDDGKVKVLNAGFKKTKEGKRSQAVGKAKLASAPDTAYLKVSFFGPFYADYIVVALDKENYSYAMVASSYDYLWILCRTPAMAADTYQALVEKAKQLGFDMSRLIQVPQ